MVTVLQLVTVQKTFKSSGKMCLKYIFALLMTLCNDVPSDELFQIFQMIAIP